ncbi:hypothetical protein ACFYWN_44745 [Streptomyces sp. NPDC002917]|uniref:hypothetical protein n=1 Tax=Streptomyces sp. NPDC002917 TaxID=3364671 RepID=UPI00368B1579
MFSADDFHPLPLPRPDERTAAVRAETEADTLLAAAKAEAKKIRETAALEAQGLLTRALASANGEADQIREAARAETAKRQKRDDLDTWSARAVIAGAVGLTASGEFELAKMVGFDGGVAWLLPLVIDVYVIQAFRRHRDVMQAIGLTIAANVIYHLADAGLFGVNPGDGGKADPKWWLIAIVASVASLILWRMHTITAPAKTKREPRQPRRDRQQATTPAPVLAPAPRQEAPANSILSAPPIGDSGTARSDRQNDTSVAVKKATETPAKKTAPVAKKVAAKSRQKPAVEKTPRRSMAEWVTLAEPIFHTEFRRLKRNPTAAEFADAISKAGHGRPSDSTAKNIRTEILDRAELPALKD